MEEGKDFINLSDRKSLMEFLRSPTLKISEFLTGLIISDKNEYRLSTGRLVQAAIKHNLYEQLGREIKHYRDKGKIKEDYFSTDKQRATLRELLEFIDKEAPDEDRFKAMKSIFLMAISKETTEADEILAYELMQICKELLSNDILMLKAIYNIAKGGGSTMPGANLETKRAEEWIKIVAYKIGHKMPALVELSEKELMDLKLIGGRYGDNGTIIQHHSGFRLTELGMKLCEYITAY